MIAFFLAPVYLLFNFYVLRWSMKWARACVELFVKRKRKKESILRKAKYIKVVYIILYLIVSCSMLISFLIRNQYLRRLFKHISNYWLGVFLYLLLIIAIVDLVKIILRWTKVLKPEIFQSLKLFVAVGAVLCVCIIGVSAYGIFHAQHIYTTKYEVELKKDCGEKDSLKIVMVADLHLGYSVGVPQVEKMVKKINEADADLVCMAGDIFDNEYEALDDPDALIRSLKKIKSKYGVYAAFGNHDLQEKILAGFTFDSGTKVKGSDKMEELLQKADIKHLQDETIFIDNEFYLVGREDYSRAKKVDGSRKTPEELMADIDQSKPIFVIDHQPKELQELADSGADLDMSGHTHDGQMFPGNITTSMMWENPCGYLKKDDMHSIVTSGIGVWGPNMRVGTKSEIAEITVRFMNGATE